MSAPEISAEAFESGQNAPRIFSVVYQMGKVASTSIVSTLNEIDGLEAVQAHFLGERSLSAMVSQITNPDIPDYFFRHSLGQFIENTKTTRRMNLVRAGKTPGEKLLVISLSRNPVEWIRSSVVQDITGYLPVLKSVCEKARLNYATDAEAVIKGLRYVVGKSCDLLNRFGGIDRYLGSQLTYSKKFENSVFESDPDAARLFMMFLRPANWFESHFQPALSIRLDEMVKEGFTWGAAQGNAYFVIVRYEDMLETLPKWLEETNLCKIDEFKHENLSVEKNHAAEARSVFGSESGDSLRELYKNTHYSRFFGYS